MQCSEYRCPSEAASLSLALSPSSSPALRWFNPHEREREGERERGREGARERWRGREGEREREGEGERERERGREGEGEREKEVPAARTVVAGEELQESTSQAQARRLLSATTKRCGCSALSSGDFHSKQPTGSERHS